MTKNEFLLRFQLQQLKKTGHYHWGDLQAPIKKAAVLIPLLEANNQLNVLLTIRSAHLKYHAGQICFPGGRVEKSDKSLTLAALREANEEIGLPYNRAEVIGQFGRYQTLTGYDITPIVTFIPADYVYQQNQAEVAKIFTVPLNHFLDLSNHHIITVKRGQKSHPVTFIPYQEYNIWGATAAILRDLALHLD